MSEVENVEEVGGGLGPASNSMAAFSDKLNDLSDALNVLYIINNASGRHKFRAKWPEVAEFLFDEQLTIFDVDGFDFDDRPRRGELEEEADFRRIDLKKVISEIVEKSVNAGSLQFDYVGGIVDKHGAKMSTYLYDRPVIERVRPGLMAELEAEEASKEEKARKQREQRESEIRNNMEQMSLRVSDFEAEQEERVPEALSEEASVEQEAYEEKTEEISDVTIPEKDRSAEDEKLSYEEKTILSNNGDEPPDEKIEVAPVIDIAADIKPIEVGVVAVPEDQGGGDTPPSVFEVGSDVQEKKAHYISAVDSQTDNVDSQTDNKVETEAETETDAKTETEEGQDESTISKWQV